jgi:hypothetical protein
MAQRYSSIGRYFAQPIPDQGLEVHWYGIGLSTNANAVFFSHCIGISLHGPSAQIASERKAAYANAFADAEGRRLDEAIQPAIPGRLP